VSVILGIESSCDETGVAVVRDGVEILSNQVASQIAVHAPFGGVVPEIASREHTKCISQLARMAIEEAGAPIDAVAATAGPGLMGSLMVGVNFAKAAAWAAGLPFVPVHHIEGHLFSAFMGEKRPEFPFLSLIVSGGHTQLVWCERAHDYRILGSTRDDAVGECFDKAAKMLGLPYPGGPSIQKAAENGDPAAWDFPRSMANSDTLEFSYSGLKTAVLYALREGPPEEERTEQFVADMAASFQHAAVDILIIKTRQAIAQTGARQLVVAGGVAANRLLRDRLNQDVEAEVFVPPLRLCLDNGAMIAAAAEWRLQAGLLGDAQTTPSASLALC
jgi:N6-L-threonylcarbamoyladenine synthase